MEEMALEGTLHRVFVQKLRAIRIAQNLTQAEVAERMGITQGAYSHLEQGRFSPTLTTVEKAAVALGVAAEDFVSSKKIAEAPV